MAKYQTECQLEFHHSETAGTFAIVTMVSMVGGERGENENHPITWSDSALESLSRVLDRVASDPAITGWILTGSHGFFSAGADIMSVNLSLSRADALNEGRKGHRVFKRIMDLDIPTVAAINGLVMGGGLESSLYHDFRLISGHPKAKCRAAFPECHLGLIPGWGGTQLVPRIAGPEAAVELIIHNALNGNRLTSPERLLELGLVDRILNRADVTVQAIDFLEEIVMDPDRYKKQSTDPWMSMELYEKTYDFIKEKVRSGAVAPYTALDLIQMAADTDLETGFVHEDEALADMLMSRQFRSSMYAFDLVQRRAKMTARQFSRSMTEKIGCLGIVGSGKAVSTVSRLFVDAADVMVKVKTLDTADLSTVLLKQCQAVIVEGRAVDRSVEEELQYLAAIVPTACTILILTSFHDINRLCARLENPSRVVGMHIVCLGADLPLVEVVRTRYTDDQTLARGAELIRRTGRHPLPVQSTTGFVVNRVLGAMIDGAVTCWRKGASKNEIEEANLSLGFPPHSLGIFQAKGMDDRAAVQEALINAWPDRFHSNERLSRFLKGNAPNTENRRDSETVSVGGPLDPDAINEIVLSRMTVEIDNLLKEGVVESYKDVDTALILGAGFPFFSGGITSLLDETGISQSVLGGKISDRNTICQ